MLLTTLLISGVAAATPPTETSPPAAKLGVVAHAIYYPDGFIGFYMVSDDGGYACFTDQQSCANIATGDFIYYTTDIHLCEVSRLNATTGAVRIEPATQAATSCAFGSCAPSPYNSACIVTP